MLQAGDLLRRSQRKDFMPYTEEREFNFRIVARAEFAEDYDGEEDGYVWAEPLSALYGAMLQAMTDVVRQGTTWTMRPGNRGRSSEDEITLIVERRPGTPGSAH